jgi:hypothetical protein
MIKTKGVGEEVRGQLSGLTNPMPEPFTLLEMLSRLFLFSDKYATFFPPMKGAGHG